MSRKDKAVVPYKLNMNISLEKLMGVPADAPACEIARNWLVRSILAFGSASKGFQIQKQRQLRRIRTMTDDLVTSVKAIPLQTIIEEVKKSTGLDHIPNNEIPALVDKLAGSSHNNFKWAKEAAVKIKTVNMNVAKASVLVVEPEDFKFIRECWEGAQLEESANEVIGLIDDMIREASSQHDRELSKPEDIEVKAAETVSSREVKDDHFTKL